MQVFFGLAYFAVGFAQLFAIAEFFHKKFDWGIFDFIAALFVTYVPLLGSALGVLGAVDGWGWSYLQAGVLFFWYVPVYAIIFIIGLMGER